MATSVSICSAALMKLGDAPIASLDEPTRRAELCANIYPDAKRDVLRAHPWNCTVKRVILAPLAKAPEFSWRYAFALPGDQLRVMQVGADGYMTEYQLESGRILANTTVLPLVYVAEIDESEMDANLVQLLTARMEADLAYSITKSTSLATERLQKYELVLRRAKSTDGQENPPEDWGDSPFIQVRGGRSRFTSGSGSGINVANTVAPVAPLVPEVIATNALLTEDGFELLTEDGFKLLLEEL
jgi:hypothetical protein